VHLLRNPGVEFAATELVHTGDQIQGANQIATSIRTSSQHDPVSTIMRSDLGDAGFVLDTKAKTDYKQRLNELQDELAEAEKCNDLGRIDRIQIEIAFLVAEITASRGLHGRDRKSASHLERARSTVSKRIRLSVNRIRRADSFLGNHLAESIRTGYYCCYLPKNPVNWRF
jgi:hypothetical protein